MARFAQLALFIPLLASIASAAPITRLSKRAFQLQNYADFQISDGVAGNAAAQANAVFVDPFRGVDLTTVPQATIVDVETMRVAAENAETCQFNGAVDAASGAEAAALQAGKIKNKVLKLTGIAQKITIQLAQAKASGKDTTTLDAALLDAQTKLKTNIAIDVKSAGQPSKGVVAAAAKAPVVEAAAVAFKLQNYADFQISDGVAGNAAAQANAVFVDPFKGVDLTTVPQATIVDVETMRVAAENAETNQFNGAVDAASGAEAAALQAGKIKNKVLKLTGIAQKITIQLAQAKATGKDTTTLDAALLDAQTKLKTNIDIDVKSAGQPSKGVVGAASVAPVLATVPKPVAAAGAFKLQDYAAFQISSGVAGKAEAEANAVFVDPFANVDLTTIDQATIDALQTMREAAEAAETDNFNVLIAAASGADAAALQVGKIKNKVLKLTGEVQVLKIQAAQAKAAGKDSSKLDANLVVEQTKLTKNIATDVKSAGQASKAAV